MPTPIAAIAYSKILKTSFGMADLDKTDQADAIAEPVFIDIGLGEVRCLHGTLIRFRRPRNDTHALSLTLPRVNSRTRCAASASTTRSNIARVDRVARRVRKTSLAASLEPQRRAVV
jgi:hypothetical protein